MWVNYVATSTYTVTDIAGTPLFSDQPKTSLWLFVHGKNTYLAIPAAASINNAPGHDRIVLLEEVDAWIINK